MPHHATLGTTTLSGTCGRSAFEHPASVQARARLAGGSPASTSSSSSASSFSSSDTPSVTILKSAARRFPARSIIRSKRLSLSSCRSRRFSANVSSSVSSAVFAALSHAMRSAGGTTTSGHAGAEWPAEERVRGREGQRRNDWAQGERSAHLAWHRGDGACTGRRAPPSGGATRRSPSEPPTQAARPHPTVFFRRQACGRRGARLSSGRKRSSSRMANAELAGSRSVWVIQAMKGGGAARRCSPPTRRAAGPSSRKHMCERGRPCFDSKGGVGAFL
mmetsp:Transcript_54843/g.108921  ORF Transcript_54843/g.108921 Transcript_54843/m.108921 type:complete len:276 (-) Transcript_54843:28-855(-)